MNLKDKKSVFKENPSKHINKKSTNTNQKKSYKLSKPDNQALIVRGSNSSNINKNIEEAEYEILSSEIKTNKKDINNFEKYFETLCPAKIDVNQKLEICKNLLASMYSVIRRQDKELKIFKSDRQKQTEAVDIYIHLLKNSEKLPNLKALELASHKTYSKSSWHRYLKDLKFLTPLVYKVLNLIKMTKDPIKRTLYEECITTLYKSLNKLAKRETIFNPEILGGPIRNNYGKERDVVEHATDSIQFKNFNDRNGYLEIDEQIDKDIEDKSINKNKNNNIS